MIDGEGLESGQQCLVAERVLRLGLNQTVSLLMQLLDDQRQLHLQAFTE